MTFNAIRENKILAKISEFTVLIVLSYLPVAKAQTSLYINKVWQEPLLFAYMKYASRGRLSVNSEKYLYSRKLLNTHKSE